MNTEHNTAAGKVIIRSFPFPLSDDEQRERGQRLAAEIQELYDARAAAKESAAEHKKNIERHEATISALREVVATGVEQRDVECQERVWRANGEAVVVRVDTGEEISRRPLTQGERQMDFPFGGEE